MALRGKGPIRWCYTAHLGQLGLAHLAGTDTEPSLPVPPQVSIWCKYGANEKQHGIQPAYEQ